MKILHIIGAAKIGGVEISVQQFLECAISIDDQTQHFVAGNFRKPKLKFPNTIAHLHLKTDTDNPFLIIVNAYKIAKFVKENNINILHSYNRNTTWTIFFVKKILNNKIKTVSTISGLYKLSGIFRKLLNSVFLKTDFTIATSTCVKQHFLSHYKNAQPDNITIIYEGIKVNNLHQVHDFMKDNQNALGSRTFKIVMLARFSKIKGQNLLLHALKRIPSNINYECFLIGPPKNKFLHYLKNLINTLKVSVKIYDPNFAGLIQFADVVVCPSTRGESFGRVAVEAGFLKKIAIVSNAGGHLEVVKNQETGFYFEMGDVDDLASKIIQVYNLTKIQRKEMQKNAFEYVSSNFSIHNHTMNKQKFYQNINKH